VTTPVPATCPAADELERAIRSGVVPPELADHLSRCASCRAAELQIRENLAFMEGVLDRLGPAGTADAMEDRTPPDPELLPGYSLVREIARGGQGIVYEGVQTSTRRRVAVKIIDAGRRGVRSRRRIEREAEIVAGLRHPNIVTVYHSTPMDDGRYALAMEYIDGVPIDAWSRSLDESGPRDRDACRDAVRAKLRAMIGVCDAVQYAHQNGVIHRDLKPANVLVDRDGTPRVVDFGIARRLAAAPAITRTGAFAGTLAYASPEQVSGSADAVDTRSDVYSLGLILYELLTMRRPYDTEGSLTGAIANITTRDPAPLGNIEPGGAPAGAELEAIVRRAMAKERDRRYQTAGALAADLQNYLDGRLVDARRESSTYILRKTLVRHRVPVTIAAAFVVLLAALAVSTAWSSRRLARQGALLAENLAASNIERARLLGLTGQHARAEAILWPELIRAGGNAADPALGFDSTPAQTRAAWAMRDLYSRYASLMKVRGRPCPPGQDAAVTVAFDRPSGNLHVVYADGTREIRDAADGRVIRVASGLGVSGWARGEVSTSQNHAFIFGIDAITLTDLRTGASERFEHPEFRGVTRADITPDGERMLTMSNESTLSLWQVRPLRKITTFTDRLNAFGQGRFSPDGSIAGGAFDGAVRIWRASDGTPLRHIQLPPSVWTGMVRPGVAAIRIRPDNRQVAISMISALLFIDLDHPEQVPKITPAHPGFINSMRYSDDGKYLVTSGQENGVRVWDTTTGACLNSVEVAAPLRGTPVISPDSSIFALTDSDNVIHVYEMRPEPWRVAFEGIDLTVNRVAFSPDGATIAAACADGRTRLWRVADHSLVWSVDRPEGSGNALAFSADGRRLAVASEAGQLLQLSAADGAPLAPPATTPNRPTWIGYAPGDGTIAVACSQTNLEFYDAADGSLAFELRGHTRRVAEAAFSPDGILVATASPDGLCIIWDLATRTPLRRLTHPQAARAVAFSPDGLSLATGADDRIIRLWDVRTGTLSRVLAETKQHVFGLAFHPAGSLLFSCSRDPVIQIWDARSGLEVATLTGHRDVVTSLAISPDGTHLVAGSSDRTVGLWDLHRQDRQLIGNRPLWVTPVP
jgi:WD40 repeat protein/serine/threonine protein kinase